MQTIAESEAPYLQLPDGPSLRGMMSAGSSGLSAEVAKLPPAERILLLEAENAMLRKQLDESRGAT
eukprot:CAMPEP_0176320128 /NCGR_PEP_ID=MMETSP0121_2-20121125/70661_1 /TAXON_ID=160619 /ORGANISM="Kryptoperidinium foliaceum, Strain CCMP 1326" /LENGTH=65 /DNA_ID=CAMNT_0017662505 /DNA_START=53 /DNA_END=246 /DNA_ORIENTATION=-